ncbi:MAG: helix-turn-helix transcriptional regulator [Bacteroidaceae bacterium]|nr:helix-turn-helix transcriptional regulator [Bacteroidaceae bacterium]
MEKAVTKRIKCLMDEFGDNKNSLSVKIGMASSTFGRYVNGENKPTVSLLQLILSQYSDISADWLLMGEGEMYKKTTELPFVDVTSEESIEHSAEIAKLVREKNALIDTNEELREENKMLRAQLEVLKDVLRTSLGSDAAQKVG